MYIHTATPSPSTPVSATSLDYVKATKAQLQELQKHISNLTTPQINDLKAPTSWHAGTYGNWQAGLGFAKFSHLLPADMPPLTSNPESNAKSNQAFKEKLNTHVAALEQMAEMIENNPNYEGDKGQLFEKVAHFRSLPPAEKTKNERDADKIRQANIDILQSKAPLTKEDVNKTLDNLFNLSDINDDNTATELECEVISWPFQSMTTEQKNIAFFVIERLAQEFKKPDCMDEYKNKCIFELANTYFVYADIGSGTHQHIDNLCDHMQGTEHEKDAQTLKASLAEGGELRNKINYLNELRLTQESF